MGSGIRGWRRVGLGVEMGGFRDQGWRLVGLGVEMGGFRDQGWRLVGLGVEMGGFRDQGWRRVGLGICKVGGVGSGSNLAPWIFCPAARTISNFQQIFIFWVNYSFNHT